MTQSIGRDLCYRRGCTLVYCIWFRAVTGGVKKDGRCSVRNAAMENGNSRLKLEISRNNVHIQNVSR